jgi:hypothetical protein
MSQASKVSELLLWMLVGGYAANLALSRVFGDEWPKQLGDAIRQWWHRRGGETDANP